MIKKNFAVTYTHLSEQKHKNSSKTHLFSVSVVHNQIIKIHDSGVIGFFFYFWRQPHIYMSLV